MSEGKSELVMDWCMTDWLANCLNEYLTDWSADWFAYMLYKTCIFCVRLYSLLHDPDTEWLIN